jgi:serine/threonine protein phosphatase PrpC
MPRVVVGSATADNRKTTSAGTAARNEDRVSFQRKGQIVGIYDGHGGALCVDYVAKHAPGRLESALVSRGLLQAEASSDCAAAEAGRAAKSSGLLRRLSQRMGAAPIAPPARPPSQEERKQAESESEDKGDVTESSGPPPPEAAAPVRDDAFPLVAAAFMETFQKLEGEFRQVFDQTGSVSGTCVLMTFLHLQMCYVAHAGDCRAIYRPLEARKGFFGKVKPTVQVTTDHRVNVEGDERERVQSEGGVVRNGRIATLSPSRTIGDFDVKLGLGNKHIVSSLPDVNAFPVTEPTIVILGTDGVWDGVSNARAMDLVDKSLRAFPGEPGRAASAVVLEAAQNTRDDVTCVVMLIEP